MRVEQSGNGGATAKWLVAGLAAWFVTALVASASGLLGRLSPWVIMPMVPALMLGAASMYWSLPQVRRVVEQFGLRRLTVLHVFRIAAVPLFFWYERHGLLPAVFLERGAWGDLAAGVAALIAVTVWARPAGYWFAHLVGMADFATVLFTSGALTKANLGSMVNVTGLPFSMLPFYFVGVLGSTHLMAYTMMLRGRAGADRALAPTVEVAR